MELPTRGFRTFTVCWCMRMQSLPGSLLAFHPHLISRAWGRGNVPIKANLTTHYIIIFIELHSLSDSSLAINPMHEYHYYISAGGDLIHVCSLVTHTLQIIRESALAFMHFSQSQLETIRSLSS